MSNRRTIADFPRNEAGLVDNFLGTAYDTVKAVYDALPEIRHLDEIADEIPQMGIDAVEAAMVPARVEIQGYVDEAEAAADAAAQSALEATKVSLMYPFTFLTIQTQYDVTVISGRSDATTAGLALWVEGAIEYDFTIISGTKFTINSPDLYANGAQMRIIINARFDDLVKNFDDLEETFDQEFDADQAARTVEFEQFLLARDYEVPVPYSTGLVLTRSTQVVTYQGDDYRIDPSSLPYTTTNWAADTPVMRMIGNHSLRTDLALISGATNIGWGRSVLTEAINDAGDVFNSRNVDVREFSNLIVKPNPLNPTTWDWSAAAQAAIDMAESLGLVAIMANREMRLLAPLQLGNNSRLYLPAACTLIKDFEGLNTWTGTLKNKGDAVGKDNILIFGYGAIKSAVAANVYGGQVGKHIVLFNCNNVRVSNIRILNTYNDWTTKFQNCSNVLVDGVTIDVGSTAVLTDGLHFKGRCNKVVIANCNIKTGDDCIALTQEIAGVDDAGDITDVVVVNCVLDTGQSSLVKIHCRPAATTGVHRVNISNIVGKVGRINAGGFSFYFTDDGLTRRVHDIKVTNITGDCTENGDYCARVVGCQDVQIDKFTAFNALRGFLVEESRHINVSNVRIHPLRGTGGQVSSGMIFQNVDWFSIENPRISGTGQHGLQLGSTGKPARYGSVRGGTLYSNFSTGLRLTNADGVTVDDVTCYLNNVGIAEDAGSDNNRLTNNDVRNNTTTPLSVIGAATRTNQNIGYVGASQGSATIPAGSTFIDVTHGLSAIPSLNGIKPNRINSGGASVKYWVSNNTLTQFRINVDVDPGAPTAIFGWTAKLTFEN